jgi:hypothetical protein
MQQVVVDIRMYLLYLLLMMWGFACAYCVLFRRDQEHEVCGDEFRSETASVLAHIAHSGLYGDLNACCELPQTSFNRLDGGAVQGRPGA